MSPFQQQAWQAADGEPIPFREVWGERGAFTTLRVRMSPDASTATAVAWDAHLTRIARDFQNETGVALTERREGLEGAAVACFQRWLQTAPKGDWLVRLAATAEGVRTFAARPLAASAAALEGVVHVHERARPASKHLNYAQLLQWMAEVDRVNTEIILASKDGCLLEGATTNLIAVVGDTFFYPAQRCLPGITLERAIDWLGREHSVEIADIRLGDLDRIDALLCCGTGRGIIPINRLPALQWAAKSTATIPPGIGAAFDSHLLSLNENRIFPTA